MIGDEHEFERLGSIRMAQRSPKYPRRDQEPLQAKVDTLRKLQADTAAELNALLPSILDKAFTAPPPRIYDQLTETR